jgi:hypothetical protein
VVADGVQVAVGTTVDEFENLLRNTVSDE